MYYDLLVKIKNAEAARKRVVRTPFSKMDMEVAKVLVDSHYLKDARKKTIDKKSFLEIELIGREAKKTLSVVKLMSKPSRRFYVNYRELKPVKQGYGLGVVSTSKGIMTTVDAKKNKVGGEYLFQIW